MTRGKRFTVVTNRLGFPGVLDSETNMVAGFITEETAETVAADLNAGLYSPEDAYLWSRR